MIHFPAFNQKGILHCRWNRTGALDVWVQAEGGRPLDADAVRTVVFGWHALSFYGTALETGFSKGVPSVSVPIYSALHYFVTTRPLGHLRLEAGPSWEAMAKLAPLFWEALEQGRYMPDMESWLQGKAGWKWIPDDNPLWEQADALAREIGMRSASDGLSHVLRQLSERDYTVYEALQAVNIRLTGAAKVNAGDGAGGSAGGLDEEDWLDAAGWKTGSVPFSVALRLAEPPEPGRSGWPLQIVLQDRRDPEHTVICTAGLTPVYGELPAEWEEAAREKTAARTKAWLKSVPELADPEQAGRLKTELTDREAWAFLTDYSLRLARAGCPVQLPAWWNPARRTRPRLKAKVATSVGTSAQPVFGLEQLVRFDWRIALGDAELTLEQFQQLVDREQRLYVVNGRWIQLDPAMLEQLNKRIKRLQKKGLALRDVLRAALGANGAGAGANAGTAADPLSGAAPKAGAEARADAAVLDPEGWDSFVLEIELNTYLRQMVQQLKETRSIPRLSVPQALHGELRDYQVEGFSWMVFLQQYGLGGCLADDMGLGKTVQWIAYLLYLKQEKRLSGPALLICPTSVLGNWQKELERFAPSLKLYLHHGPARAKGKLFPGAAANADVVLTTYALAPLDREELGGIRWSTLCLDEAQNIKNAYTKQASAIRSFRADHRIALTGTPMENRLTELWSIMDFLNPHYLGSLRQFVREFVTPIEKTKDPAKIAQVQKMIQPFILRREKQDPGVRLDLPEKVESKVYVPLTAEQAALYEQVLEQLFAQLDRLEPMERKGRILAALTRLKQICDHPALFRGEGRLSPDPRRSGKMQRLMEIVEELRAQDDRCLIFSQFVEMGYIIQAAIRKQLGENPLFLHGSVPRKERDRMIRSFQEGETGVLILSLRAGGTGLNLTAARHVIHVDRWWNPAVEDQATDRAYRIGQRQNVQVHKMITLGTLEERIDELLERKQGLNRQIIGSGEQWITEVSDEELRELFALRRNWVDV